MKRRALFLVTADPRASHRPGEAIRIAAGVAAWKNVDVTLCLWNHAALALSEFTEELVGEENFRNCLPMLTRLDRPIYVQRDTPWLARLANSPAQFEPISEDQLAGLAAGSHYVMRF